MSKQRCQKIAESMFAIIHDGDDLRLEAPKGKTFDGQVHEYVYAYDDGDKALAWADMLEVLKEVKQWGSFPACSIEDCEWCNE